MTDLSKCAFGKVTKIFDGDTFSFEVLRQGENLDFPGIEGLIRIRIACIDTPETKQGAIAHQAKNMLTRLVSDHNNHLWIEPSGKSHDRIVAWVFGKNPHEEHITDLGKVLVLTGQAKVLYNHLNDYPNKWESYIKAQAEAQLKRRGIWSKDCIEPDTFKILQRLWRCEDLLKEHRIEF
ncbi:MAG: thermonuclease family protein [Symploca sp. SIO1C4]|uniref:Thermonuclease family protein n=1 Tax=Symploca sp. SIO1C4 TaxID=2607765 RepID=A0A6B3NG93_9CYAN|nr:thermonuclease family protein [Symploca sp. SIO1C4]